MRRPDIQAALAKTMGVFMPGAGQGSDGEVTVSSAPKASSSSNSSPTAPPGAGAPPRTSTRQPGPPDSPSFHLVQALATLVTADGDPAIDGIR
ncbi:MAG: hypothetical protein IPL96_17755 [Holophagaceae bacterium]|nr:hypothetical protein [Holophagaceae bacterium]